MLSLRRCRQSGQAVGKPTDVVRLELTTMPFAGIVCRQRRKLNTYFQHNMGKLTYHMYICSEHFEKSCFKRDLRAELLRGKPDNDLQDDQQFLITSHYVKSEEVH